MCEREKSKREREKEEENKEVNRERIRKEHKRGDARGGGGANAAAMAARLGEDLLRVRVFDVQAGGFAVRAKRERRRGEERERDDKRNDIQEGGK